MNVRIDYQPGGGSSPRRPSSAPGGPGRKRRSKDAMLFGAVGVGALALILAAVTVHGSKDTGGTSAPSPSPSSSAAAGSNPGGLSRGTASAAGLDGTQRVAGIPRGFPHTTDGAVESASTGAAAAYSMLR